MWCMRSERGMLLLGRYVSLQALLSFTTHRLIHAHAHTYTHTHTHTNTHTFSPARSLARSSSRSRARTRAPALSYSHPTTIYIRHLERTQGTLKVRLERTQAILQVHTLKMLRSLSDTPMTHC